ncbi:SPOR domain-containing protein [Flavobacteriaceae bacterium]|nr:SPOR domain-containing protein [Flavobacteriaceae bacterium]
MEVFNHIQSLLFRYECVIVPGFGAFLTRHHSAVVDAAGQFTPPGKSVSFNRQLQTNDGLLAHYLSDVDGVPYELALQRLRALSAEMTQRLQQGAVIDCGALGGLKSTSDGIVIFEPSGQINFATSSFGLGPIVVSQVNRQGQATKVKPLFDGPAKSIPIWRYAAVALIALSIGGFGATQKYNQQVASFNLDAQQNVSHLVTKKLQEATFEVSSAVPVMEVVIPQPVTPYHVVAGAFRIEQNAHKKINQLAAKGYNAKIIGVNTYGLHQVVYQSFLERDEAINALRRIQKEDSKDAWLLVQ